MVSVICYDVAGMKVFCNMLPMATAVLQWRNANRTVPSATSCQSLLALLLAVSFSLCSSHIWLVAGVVGVATNKSNADQLKMIICPTDCCLPVQILSFGHLLLHHSLHTSESINACWIIIRQFLCCIYIIVQWSSGLWKISLQILLFDLLMHVIH